MTEQVHIQMASQMGYALSEERLGKHVTWKPYIVHSSVLCDIRSCKLYRFINVIFEETVK